MTSKFLMFENALSFRLFFSFFIKADDAKRVCIFMEYVFGMKKWFEEKLMFC